MLRPGPEQRTRLEEIVDNLGERLAEARERGWLGEVEGIEVSIAAAKDKLDRMNRIVGLGLPTISNSRPDHHSKQVITRLPLSRLNTE